MTSSDKDTEKQIDTLVNQLSKFEAGKPLDKFIKYAVFPWHKSLESGARINFDFPITVLAGPSGSIKTSKHSDSSARIKNIRAASTPNRGICAIGRLQNSRWKHSR